MTHSPVSLLLDFLFPPRCPLCRAYVETRGTFCAACRQMVLRPHRLALPPALAAIVHEAWAVAPYHEGLQPVIRALKYGGKRALLPAFHTLLVAASLPLLRADFAVPVPLHAARERERGFNQAEAIFHAYLAAQRIPILRALARTRPTPPLYGLAPHERKAALRGAFALAEPIAIRGRHILLIDDILTTGATLTACAHLLKKGGAARIDLLVLASDHA